MRKTKRAVLCIMAGVIALAISCSKSSEDTITTPAPAACDTTNMSYTGDVKPILQSNCYNCHGNGSADGGISLDSYSGVEAVAANGDLIGTITHTSGYPPMPEGGGKLSDCDINKIKAWINRGIPNN